MLAQVGGVAGVWTPRRSPKEASQELPLFGCRHVVPGRVADICTCRTARRPYADFAFEPKNNGHVVVHA
eukprot:15439766-Alexandrium_andersonii.AAC.1